MKRTNYTAPATGNAPVNIPATILLRRMVIRETDTGGTKQGITITYPDGSSESYAPTSQPVLIGSQIAAGAGRGATLGWPAQSGVPVRAADVVCRVVSMGTATAIVVEEYE
jgi:hypothetical protein